MNEVYKPIKGYENLYEVSNKGNVKSLVNRYKNTKGIFLLNQENVKSGSVTYKRVQLSNPKKRFLVHRLLAQTFLDNVCNKPHVNHIDNNPSNNHKDNIEWCTHSENMLHCHKQNRCSNIKASNKAKNDMAKKMRNFFSTLLENRFIDYVIKKGRGYVVYYCINCNKLLESRADSSTFDNGGICRSCGKNKI